MANDQKIGKLILFKEELRMEDDKEKDAEPPAIELHPTKNIVLVGHQGNGKSATGNSILGEKAFDLRTNTSSVKMACQSNKCVTPNETILNVIDTTGLCDLSVSPDLVGKEIVKCLRLADGGLHAVLFVLSVKGQVSKEDEMVLSTLENLFGSKILEYLIIVFSAGDVLEDHCVTLDEVLGDYCPAFLKRVLELCGNRKIAFDNQTTDAGKKTKQVDDLLNLIDLVGEQNMNIPYTHKMYNEIKEENERRKKEQAELESKGHEQNPNADLKAILESVEQMAEDKKIGELIPFKEEHTREDDKQNKNTPYTDKMYYEIKEENDRHKKEEAELEEKGLEQNPKAKGILESVEQLDADKITTSEPNPDKKNYNKKKEDKEYNKRVDDKKKDAAPPAKKDNKEDPSRFWSPVIKLIAKGFPNSNRGSNLPQDNERAQNIVMVGRTGNGKSAIGNSILGKKVFDSKRRGSGVTMECQSVKCVTPNGRVLNVIDTPGLFDLSVSADFIGEEIVKCLCQAEGGLHAVLLVLSLNNRISEEEEKVLSTLQILFGSKICEYVIVVFTAGDVLDEDGLTLDTYLGPQLPKFLKTVFRLCGNRKIVFDNKTTDEEKKTKQVHELLNLIDKVKMQNKNIPYTDKMYYKIKEVNDRHEKEQAALESKGLSEKQLETLTKELQMMHEQNLKKVSDMMAKNIRESQEKDNFYREKVENLEKQLEGGCAIL